MKQLKLRLPDELHTELRQRAAQDKRSLNAEILWFLEQAVRKQGVSDEH
jgi:hypothetical protein